MRIALILPGFSADESDWCIPALLNLVRAMSQRVELEVFTLRYPHRRDRYRIGNATVHSLGWAQRRGVHSATLWGEAVRLIAWQHRARPFDGLHAFWADEPGWIGATCARLLNRPLVVSLAGGELSDLPAIGYGVQRQRTQRALIDWALRRAALVTGGSQYILDIARAHGIANMCLSPLGVDTRLFCPPSAVRRPPSSLITVGSLAPVKGHMFLLRAMRRVVDAMPEARLRIVGDGPLKNNLVSEIERLGLNDNVELCAAVAHDALPALYRASDLLVQSSWHEAQGMAVLEAAACGVPCVGTDVGVACDLAPTAARVVPVGDDATMAEAIIELLRDNKTRAAMGMAARMRVAEFYSVEKCVNRFVELYQRTSKTGVAA